MTDQVSILDQPDRLGGPLLGAIALHAAVIGGLLLSASFTNHRPAFGSLQAGGNAIGVEAVNTIPLVHHGAPNPVANDTESEIPQTPVKAPDRVKEEKPPPDAIPLKMRKQLVKEKELRFSAGNWTAYAGQVMQLPEGPRKRRFAALIRTGYDKDALAIFQVEVIGYDRRFFRNELIG